MLHKNLGTLKGKQTQKKTRPHLGSTTPLKNHDSNTTGSATSSQWPGNTYPCIFRHSISLLIQTPLFFWQPWHAKLSMLIPLSRSGAVNPRLDVKCPRSQGSLWRPAMSKTASVSQCLENLPGLDGVPWDQNEKKFRSLFLKDTCLEPGTSCAAIQPLSQLILFFIVVLTRDSLTQLGSDFVSLPPSLLLQLNCRGYNVTRNG